MSCCARVGGYRGCSDAYFLRQPSHSFRSLQNRPCCVCVTGEKHYSFTVTKKEGGAEMGHVEFFNFGSSIRLVSSCYIQSAQKEKEHLVFSISCNESAMSV